jgi:hypothetical protein
MGLARSTLPRENDAEFSLILRQKEVLYLFEDNVHETKFINVLPDILLVVYFSLHDHRIVAQL